MSWRLGERPLRRVLVTRLRYLGDVVMATTVADALKRGDPGLEVGFLCEAAHGPVLAAHPSLDRVHLLGARRHGSDAAARPGGAAADAGNARGTVAMVRELRAARYDLAVDLFFNPRSAWLLRLAGIPLRIGGTAGGRRRLYTHAVPRARVEDPRGALDRRAPGGLGEHLCRLAPLVHEPDGCGFLAWLDEEGDGPLAPRLAPPPLSAAARGALAGAGADPDAAYLVAAPGATWPSKQWPPGHWRDLLAAAGADLPVVTLAPPGGAEAWSGLPGLLPVLPLADALAVLAASRAVVAVDGGVMHAAVALGRPVVALFGPTDPAVWFPYAGAPLARVLATRPACHPCDRHACPAAEFVCLPGLRPEAVLDVLRDLLARPAPAPGDRP